MKQTSLAILVVISGLCLLVFACRKELDYLIHDRERVAPDVMESAQVWYLQQLNPDPSIPRLVPTWKDTWSTVSIDHGKLLVVPAPENYVAAKDMTVRRFFVFKMAGGGISGGRIVEFVGEGYDVSSNIDRLLELYRSNAIPDFTGLVLEYDVNYEPLSKRSFTDGKKDSRDIELVNVPVLDWKESLGGILPEIQFGEKTMSKEVHASALGCNPYEEIYNGVPSGLAEDCVITFSVTTNSYNGCITKKTYNYLSHSCPSHEGSGSGSNSGGSGSAGGGDAPPYGGGGQRSAGDKQPASTPWRDILVDGASFKDHLELVNNWFLEDEYGNNILDENGNPIPNTEISNCHYYAFGPNSDPNSYEVPWIKYVNSPNRSNYTELNLSEQIQVGDRVCYFIWITENTYTITHSGIVTEVDSQGYATKVSSKFGPYEPVEHHPRDVPASYGSMEPTVLIDDTTRPSRIYYRKYN